MNWSTEQKILKSLQAARNLLGRAGIYDPPVELERVATICGATVDYASLGSLDACLIPKPGKLFIKVNNLKSHVRQRFSLAHEIGHILLDESLAQPEFRSAVNRPAKWKETACDFIAAELLLPIHLFLPRMKANPISSLSILRLARQFDASIEATAIRYGNFIDDDVQVILWERQDDKLVAKSRAGSEIIPTASGNTPPTILLSDTTRVPPRAVGQRNVLTDREYVPSLGHPLATEAKWLRFGSTDRVLSVTFRDGSESRVRGMQLVGKVLERQLVAAGRGSNDTGF